MKISQTGIASVRSVHMQDMAEVGKAAPYQTVRQSTLDVSPTAQAGVPGRVDTHCRQPEQRERCLHGGRGRRARLMCDWRLSLAPSPRSVKYIAHMPRTVLATGSDRGTVPRLVVDPQPRAIAPMRPADPARASPERLRGGAPRVARCHLRREMARRSRYPRRITGRRRWTSGVAVSMRMVRDRGNDGADSPFGRLTLPTRRQPSRSLPR